VILLKGLLRLISLRYVDIGLTLLARSSSLCLDHNLRNVFVLKTLVVYNFSFTVDDCLPVFLILVDKVLHLEPNSRAEFCRMSVGENCH
jgi:hypothetical protein